ncbi:hypothetical protein [Methanobacterium spitsbergense]|uniref:Portal protein n=1 Tax=Methanobacterium spitsbergense TaxID=2874285 RepID=A0A8T5V223_9EURY|nr:hypothetical protein [Methanobacterium spitsbergense]MBZ2166999.1 hypothetical protein [Methanobacterium spitsbergense]
MSPTNNETANIPIMGNDAQDRMFNAIQRFDSSFRYHELLQVLDFPYANEYELVMHYTRGKARPFVDIKTHADVGVGFELNPVGFKDDATGDDAKEKAEAFIKEIDLNGTLKNFLRWYRILGRGCIIETRDGLGNYYQDPNIGVTGFDSINPMTLTYESIDNVMSDPTGLKQYQQNTALGGNKTAPTFSQDRVIYRTNSLSKLSVMGDSKLQNCIVDLRNAGRFPHNRRDLAKIYSQISRIVTLNIKQLRELEMGQAATATNEALQAHMDNTAEFYRRQEERGGTFVVPDWETVIQSSFAGKEVKMVELEMQTYESIGREMGVPLALVMSVAAGDMNRATMESVTDLFVSMQEKGTRDEIVTPIIERCVNNYLNSQGITEGRLEVEYNPFLPVDMEKVGRIIQYLWPTGAISRPDVRQMARLPNAPYMGGQEWDGMDPFPTPQEAASTPTASTGETLSTVKDLLFRKDLLKRL